MLYVVGINYIIDLSLAAYVNKDHPGNNYTINLVFMNQPVQHQPVNAIFSAELAFSYCIYLFTDTEIPEDII